MLELFAGSGGASEGIRRACPDMPAVGIEWDAAACATRRAAGLLTIRADVAAYPVEPFIGRVTGLWLSPPCPDFSSAGKRAGIEGTSGHLIFQVLRWTLALRPTWLACEQVPEVLPWWRHFARQLEREAGYKTWTGVLCAADYGVPQERYRAVLMAHADRPVQPPEPTHAETPHPSMFGDELAPWVSMAEGLGWGMTRRPYVTVTTGGASTGGVDPMLLGGSGARRTIEREGGASLAIEGTGGAE